MAKKCNFGNRHKIQGNGFFNLIIIYSVDYSGLVFTNTQGSFTRGHNLWEFLPHQDYGLMIKATK